MFKRLLALLTMLMLPLLAQAEATPEYQIFTFAEALPERLTEPLSALLPDESKIVSGAAIRHNSSYVEPDEPASRNSYSAMLLVDTTDGLRLLTAAWVDGLPWQVNDFTHLLRRDSNVFITVYQPSEYSIPMFSVDYPAQEGMVSDLMLFRGNRLWHLTGHINEAAGLTISVDLGSATVIDAQGRDMFACSEAYWMDYLDSIENFPISRAEVETLDIASKSILVSNTAAGRAYTEGANLRREPTSKSASLGVYNEDVPLALTGNRAQGTQYSWIEVRIGNTTGWMSANYIQENIDQYYPVPMGRTVSSCPFYAAIGDAQPTMQLSPGVTFHILAKIDGMYHICIPHGDISWAVDRNGTYGYISTKDILQGAGVSVLDALEAAQ